MNNKPRIIQCDNVCLYPSSTAISSTYLYIIYLVRAWNLCKAGYVSWIRFTSQNALPFCVGFWSWCFMKLSVKTLFWFVWTLCCCEVSFDDVNFRHISYLTINVECSRVAPQSPQPRNAWGWAPYTFGLPHNSADFNVTPENQIIRFLQNIFSSGHWLVSLGCFLCRSWVGLTCCILLLPTQFGWVSGGWDRSGGLVGGCGVF